MKHIILLAVFFVATQSFAQELKLDMGKVKKYLDQDKARQGNAPNTPKNQLSQLLNKKSMSDTVAFSHSTPQGDVFVLPQDNMPCLQPLQNTYANNMPNAVTETSTNKTKATAQIPNAFRGRPLVLKVPKTSTRR